MREGANVVFLLDVDNTLLDNDHVIADLRAFLEREVGHLYTAEYFRILEELRSELGYVDYLGTLQRFREHHPHVTRVLAVSSFLVDYPFANRLFPGSLDAIARLRTLGLPVVLSDGDVVFQPRKIERSGIRDEVEGRVLIYIHKEQELAEVEKHFPARRYVLVDDKLKIPSAVKEAWGDRVTTVFPRQGHYAHDPELLAAYPEADITIERIGELADLDLASHIPELRP